MITPAYTITASERILPRLALDFTTGVLDSRVSVTRSLNTATRINSSGLIETVNADLPRFDYAPVTQAPRGLLIEEQRSNLVLNSAAFDVASWVKAGTSITANAVVSPDGNSNADKMVENSATSPHAIYATFTYGAGLTYAASIYAKKAERNWLYIGSDTGTTNEIVFFDLNSGTVGNQGTGYVGSMVDAGNGWWRCVVIITQSTALPPNYLVIGVTTANNTVSHAGDGTSGIYLWGAQLEAGAFATSYIPTTSTSLTRNADAVSMTGTNFSDWYNASEGSLMFQGDALTVANPNNMTLASLLLNGSNYIRYWMWQGQPANLRYTVVASGSGSADIVNAITANTQFKVMCSYATNLFRCALNGAATSAGTSGTVPAGLNAFYIGSLDSVNEPFNGHVAKINYYNQSVTSGEVQAFSK